MRRTVLFANSVFRLMTKEENQVSNRLHVSPKRVLLQVLHVVSCPLTNSRNHVLEILSDVQVLEESVTGLKGEWALELRKMRLHLLVRRSNDPRVNLVSIKRACEIANAVLGSFAHE